MYRCSMCMRAACSSPSMLIMDVKHKQSNLIDQKYFQGFPDFEAAFEVWG